MLKAINSYQKEVRFGFIFFVCIICAGLVLAQLAAMYIFQNEEIVWQGACKGGALADAGDSKIKMTVWCPGRDGFEIINSSLIAEAKNEDKVFFCKKTKGNIIKNENWVCHIPPKENDVK